MDHPIAEERRRRDEANVAVLCGNSPIRNMVGQSYIWRAAVSALDASNVSLNSDLGVVGPWKRGSVEGTFHAFHAQDQKESRFVKKTERQ